MQHVISTAIVFVVFLAIRLCSGSSKDATSSSSLASISSCEWLLTWDRLTCNFVYRGGRNNDSSTEPHDIDNDVHAKVAKDSQKSSSINDNHPAFCALQNASIATGTQVGDIRMLNVDCVAGSVRNVPVLDAETFKPFVSMSRLKIQNTPLMDKLRPNTFCDLPKLKILTLRRANLTDMDGHIGVGNSDVITGGGRTKLESLILDFNSITSIRKAIPLGCLAGLEWLEICNSGLEEIHPEAFVNLGNLVALDLSMNALTTLANGVFKAQANLDFLSLRNNRLRDLQSSLSDLHKLTYLNLQFNELTTVTNETFAGLTFLEELILSNNSITHVADDSFTSTKSLSKLYLDVNKLTTVPASFAVLVNLKQLELTGNAISSNDDAMLTLPPLKKLDLSGNRLTTLTSRTFSKQRDLEHLELNRNAIAEIAQDAFATTKALRIVALGNNRLTSVPNLRGLDNLEEISLNDNRIAEIPSNSFIQMAKLTKLNLKGNRLQILSDNLFVALPMVVLDVSDNEIASISNETFAGLTRLRELRMSGNKLADFHYLWFPAGLENLNLSKNSIEQIAGPSGAWMPNLGTLDLSHNAITSIQPESLSKSLVWLWLDDNRISNLKEGLFREVPYLLTVSLKRNRIRSLNIPSTYIFNSVRKPVSIYLEGNPLLCDCQLDWILTRYAGPTYEIKDYERIKCQPGFQKSNNDVIADNKLGNNTMNMTQPDELVATVAMENFMCKDDKEQPSSERPLQCSYYYSRSSITIDCSECELHLVPGFKDLERLYSTITSTVLYLDNNKISRIRNELHWLPSLRRLYLDHNVIEVLNDGAFEGLTHLELLRLDHNLLKHLPNWYSSSDYDASDHQQQRLFAPLKSLLTLDLSHNLLTNLSARLFEPLTSLQTLKLNDNRLVDYPVWTLPAQSEIGLQSNPWSCDCDYAWQFRKWIQSFKGKLIDKGNLYCVEDNRPSVSLITFNISECYEGTESKVFVFVPPAWHSKAWLASFPALLIVVAILIFIFRQEMQVLIYSRYKWRLFADANDLHDADKLYDAFLSYSSADEDFVLDEFLPGLENIENPYCLCLHHRDFPIGAFINESIFNSIATSRRSILILSENYVRSDWCRFEFRAAHSQMLQDKCKRVIVIILGKLPKQLDDEMKLYLRTYTYLAWGDRLFWKKLYFALPDVHAGNRILDHELEMR